MRFSSPKINKVLYYENDENFSYNLIYAYQAFNMHTLYHENKEMCGTLQAVLISDDPLILPLQLLRLRRYLHSSSQKSGNLS